MIATGWDAVLDAETLERADLLMARVASERRAGRAIAPGPGAEFRALAETPPARVRAVILGQDPYPTPGHADGLCFSVRPGVAPPRSLRNIFRELGDDLGQAPPESGDLGPWAAQGVLLLNSVLTVTEGAANSHAGWGWQAVTDAIVAAVSDGPAPVAFLLWGRHAEEKARLIDADRHLVLTAPHPSPLSARRGFFGCRHFSTANDWLTAQGRGAIDWRVDGAAV